MILVSNINHSDAYQLNSSTPQINSVNPVNNSIIPKSQAIKLTFSKSIKLTKNSITLKNMDGKLISTNNKVSGKSLIITPVNKLKPGKYFIILGKSAVTDSYKTGNSNYKSCFTISPISLAQMKDGKSRVERFYALNHRLPNYVNFGSKKIMINDFEKLLTTQNLKLNKTTSIKSCSITKQNGCIAYNISISSKLVSSTSKCSCGACGDYVYHTSSYKNYCPNCGRYETLVWNPKGVYEGEWTCSYCDCDYCSACGKEKVHNHPKHLIKA
ncbi:MAG: Ig-like domain-containing protein [Methanobacterium sp. ERen5]|nr:MAG: Ig-like domain-containing protein [Methanobacterium sp. ERen5]